MTPTLDAPLAPDTPIRLCVGTARGWAVLLTVPAGRKAEATAWAMQALAFAPDVRWRWEQTTGRFIRDELWAYFDGKGPAPAGAAPAAGAEVNAKLVDKLMRIAAVLNEAPL